MNTLQSATAEAPLKIYVWLDFVCPYCLIGDVLLKQAIAGLDVEVIWKPFELRPYPTPTLKPEDDYLQTVWKKHVYPTAELYKVPMKLPTISPQPYTRLAFIGMQYAASQGVADQYVLAVLEAFFQQDKDIGSIEVLVEIAQSIGLNGSGFKQSLSNQDFIAKHDAELAEATYSSIRSVPSMLLDGQLQSLVRNTNELRKFILEACH